MTRDILTSRSHFMGYLQIIFVNERKDQTKEISDVMLSVTYVLQKRFSLYACTCVGSLLSCLVRR